MINSRNISELHPTLQRGCNEFLKRCKLVGLNVLVTSTYRDNEYQDMLYNRRDGTTNARGGASWHNYRLAFDICENVKGHEYDSIKFFEDCAKIWKDMGGQWGSDVNFKNDRPHMQFTNGLTINQLKSGISMFDIKMKWETISITEIVEKLPYFLKLGSRNDYVKKAQSLLNKNGFKLTADGIFGPKTLEAVKSYQKQNKLAVDGIIGKNTWTKLNS